MDLVGTEADAPTLGRADVDVLVVDDDNSVRTSMSAVLRSAGFSVVEARDGQDAVDVLGRNRVGVIVLDLHMAPRDGIWLLERLRGDMVVIVVSAFALYGRAEILDRFPARVDHAMQKPVSPQTLIDVVQRSLGPATPPT